MKKRKRLKEASRSREERGNLQERESDCEKKGERFIVKGKDRKTDIERIVKMRMVRK